MSRLLLARMEINSPNLTGPHFKNETERCNTIITSPEGDGIVLVGKI